MKIKRYEASTMTEALRKIKKDFGEDAVILSAKTSKKMAGVFSSKSGTKVVVTAAIDMAPVKKSRDAKVTQTTVDELPAYGVHLSQTSAPIEGRIFLQDDLLDDYVEQVRPKGRNVNWALKSGFTKPQPKLVPLKSDPPPVSESESPLSDRLYKKFRAKGLNPAISHDMANQIDELTDVRSLDHPRVKDTLAGIIAAKGWVAPPVTAKGNKIRPIVLVGVHGAGKTTTAAKLAAEAQLKSKGQVCVLSLDYQRIAAHVELERAAHVMGVKLLTASSADQLNDLIPQIESARHMIIDTTGVAIGDETGREELSGLLAHLGEVEIHLVLNACLQENIASKMIEFYRPVGIERLLFTQIDNIETTGHLFNLVEANELPISYMGFGAQVPGDLHIMSAEKAAQMLLPAGDESKAGVHRPAAATEDDEDRSVAPATAVASQEKNQAATTAEENSTAESSEEFELLFKEYQVARGSRYSS